MPVVYTNFIFLPNPGREESSIQTSATGKKTLTLKIHGVSQYLKEAFPDLREIDKSDSLFPLKYDFIVRDDSSNIALTLHEVGKQAYLNIAVNNSSKPRAVERLREIQARLLETNIQKSYIDVISFDGVSEYYCSRLYPVLGKLERLLKNLLLNTYALNFDADYYEQFDESIQADAKSKIRPGKTTLHNKKEYEKAYGLKGEQLDRVIRAKHFFEALDIHAIEILLFEKRVNPRERESVHAFLAHHDDLTTIDNETLSEMFDRLTEKSDWDRFFSRKVDFTNIDDALEDVRKIRNAVAHCRTLSKDTYDNSLTLCKDLQKAIRKAIRITESKDFTQKRWEDFAETANHIRELMERFTQTIDKSVFDTIQAVSNLAACFNQTAQQALLTTARAFSSVSTILSNSGGNIQSDDDNSKKS